MSKRVMPYLGTITSGVNNHQFCESESCDTPTPISKNKLELPDRRGARMSHAATPVPAF